MVSAALGWSHPAQADFSVSYTVTEATLTLFNQPQASPFEKVRCRIQVQGDRVRFEATDHWGRTHVWISDRRSGEVLRLYPATSDYTTHKGGWPCDGLADHVAYALNYYLRAARVDDLAIRDGGRGTWGEQSAARVHLSFQARLFGLPQAATVSGMAYFPTDENSAFRGGAQQAYCGPPPAPEAWEEALTRYTALDAEEARILAGHLGLPLALELSTNLGMGQASLILAASDVSVEPLPAESFQVPADYARRVTTTEPR